MHIKSVSVEVQNCMCIKSFSHFTIKPIPNLSSTAKWSSVTVPRSEEEEIQMRILFQRSVLYPCFTFGSGFNRFTPKSVPKLLHHRIQCVLCSGSAKYRKFYVLESEVANHAAMSNRLRNSELYLWSHKSNASTDAETAMK